MLFVLEYMKTDRIKRNRWRSQSDFSYLITNTHSSPVLGKLTMTLLLPVLLSCTCPEEASGIIRDDELKVPMEIVMTRNDEADMNTLDLFAFEDDPLARLDAYLRTEGDMQESIRMLSGHGEKILFACANSQLDRYDWAAISSISSMDDIYADLETEKRNALLMTAQEKTRAGSGQACRMTLRPLVCEILLQSIRCDFSNRPYEGSVLKDVSVYLTNVNAQCSLTADGVVMPTRIINHGSLSDEDMEGFLEPDLIFRNIEEDIGEERIETGISLLCYPNASPEESPGSPFTRLVIEGSIDGERFWWPIDLNRDNEVERQGLYRNHCYSYDIVIRRKGSSDPDTPVDIEDIDLKINITPWTEKEGYPARF